VRLRLALRLAGGAWLLSVLAACAGDESHGHKPAPTVGAGRGGAGAPLAGGGAAGSQPFNNPDAGTPTPPRKPVPSTTPDGGECGATTMTAEQVVVEMHMDVTEEVTSIAPVAIYVMLDQSASMLPLWADAVAGIKAFAADPKSSGTDVALDFFPSLFGEVGECDGAGYDAPYVPIGRLPAHAAKINTELDALPLPTGIGTPIEGALNGLKRFCEQFQAAHPDEKCVGVLVTDGSPMGCNQDLGQLANIAAEAHANKVTTYAVGLTGSDFAFLDQVAMLGGAEDCDTAAPTYACDVTAGAALLVDALAKIRDTVTEVTTRTVTTTKTVETPLPCEWAIPVTPAGQTFDREKVNVQLRAPSSGETVLGKVEQEAQCARNGWYYDDPTTPTRIIACPETCELITTTAEATVDILLGCRTVPLT
jgi:hypothetical protein